MMWEMEAQKAQKGRVHRGHKGRVFWLHARQGEEDLVATACEDGTIGIWRDCDPAERRGDEKKWFGFAAHGQEALRVTWEQGNTERRVLYSGGSDGAVKAWIVDEESRAGQLVHEARCGMPGLSEDEQVYSLFHTPSGQELGVAHENKISLFDKLTFQNLLGWTFHPVGTVSIGGPRNPENRCFVFDTCTHENLVFAALSDGSVRCRDLRCPLRDVASFVGENSSFATSCCVSASGDSLAVGFGDGKSTLWDIRIGKKLRDHQLKEASPLYGMSYWPNLRDTYFAWTGAGHIVFYNSEGSSLLYLPDIRRRKGGVDYPLYCAQVTESCKRLLICGGNTPEQPKNKFGIRQTASAATGCIRINENPTNPWMSVDIDFCLQSSLSSK